jgi:hypothetical protein
LEDRNDNAVADSSRPKPKICHNLRNAADTKKKKLAPQATELNPRNKISISRNVWPSEDMIKTDISQKAFSSIN